MAYAVISFAHFVRSGMYYRTNKEAQDAHEAIRPTYSDLEPDEIKDSLTKDQYKLYKLKYIW